MFCFSWKVCIFGLIQTSFLYNYSSFSYIYLFVPLVVYLSSEILINFYRFFTEDLLSSTQALDYLMYLSTLGLAIAAILLFSEALDSDLPVDPATIPVFMIFFMHSVYRVLQEPPLILSPILNLLAPPLAVCSMTGSCNSFYISVLSSFFGAFSSSIIDLFIVLKPLTYVLLLITVISVYSTQKSMLNLPFIVACISSLIIVYGETYGSLAFITFGNFSLVATVIFNNKMLKKNDMYRV